ncbi:MAG: release factor glutamine methyltransferase [Verrucomicrobiota bacterium]|jgi:release factor glutamine methyltransferase|nr:release factor glutamine methyltransferase [Verrucomicrobiota bacterium]MEA3163214.1 release factor glutamine methyltransferase [Verrucomicrobiota bacterium]MEA3206626.1 release factor glutamine methyltransferase [Verrucomicrobiota bacterium]
MTVLELLQTTTAYFGKKGVEQPRLSIEHLLADSLGKKRIELYLEFDRSLSALELEPLREKVRRRAEGEPLQHLLGHWDFYGRTFKTDKRALIPRPETELLVDTLLKEVTKGEPSTRLVDVGTGSGVLAITLALERPELEVFALDLSEEALALARENAERLGVLDRVAFRRSDLLEGIEGPFHWVVANLPYIPTSDLNGLQREVKYDPGLALDGGKDGLTIIKRLIESVPGKIASNGMIALEIGQGQSQRVLGFLADHNYRDISIKKDYQGVERLLIARYG